MLHSQYAFLDSGKVAPQEVQEEWSNTLVHFQMQSPVPIVLVMIIS